MKSQVKRLTIDALLLTAALILSYVEVIIPIPIPIPGVKLGLANIAVMYGFFKVGKLDALAISLSRVLLMSILFGSINSFIFSLTGAVLSYLLMILSKPLYDRKHISFIGVSVLCAAAHNAGQILAAALMFSSIAVISFLPLLLLIAVPTGVLTGIVMSLIGRYNLLKF